MQQRYNPAASGRHVPEEQQYLSHERQYQVPAEEAKQYAPDYENEDFY